MILEAIYEPLFLDCSHGFRPKRSCHTALDKLKYQFGGVRWFVEGDIKGCFDNINHDALVGFIGSKVKDARIVKLVYKFLKAGYLEDWDYHKTYSGTPQGGILSPLLANIYLHELDKFVMQLKDEFDTPEKGKITPEYRELHNRIKNLCYHIDRKNGVERESMIAECKTLRKQLLKTPCTAQTDKKLKYIRYADDFIIGVKGSKEDCQWIKSKLSEFIGQTLKMELSEEKTLITHSSECARFLGFDVRVRRCEKVKRNKKGTKARTLNNHVELLVPFDDKIHNFIFSKGIAIQKKDGKLFPVHRNSLLRLTDLEIVTVYNDVFYMTFVERLTLISSLAALVSALAALFTAIAQVIIAKATNLSAYKLESEKMFFHAQVEAYESFFEAAQSFMSRSPDADAGRLTACCARAILFSSRDTCAKLSGFSSQLMEFQSNPTPESQKAFNASAYEAFEAMRQELLQMHHPLVERKHRT